MRIATWNVERPKNAGSARSCRILDKIHEVDADIWILTETHNAISPGDGYHAWATEPVPDPPTRHQDGERRAIVWSRWPFEEHIDEDMVHRTACARGDAVWQAHRLWHNHPLQRPGLPALWQATPLGCSLRHHRGSGRSVATTSATVPRLWVVRRR